MIPLLCVPLVFLVLIYRWVIFRYPTKNRKKKRGGGECLFNFPPFTYLPPPHLKSFQECLISYSSIVKIIIK